MEGSMDFKIKAYYAFCELFYRGLCVRMLLRSVYFSASACLSCCPCCLVFTRVSVRLQPSVSV